MHSKLFFIKKLPLLICSCFLLLHTANAQVKHEFSAGVGILGHSIFRAAAHVKQHEEKSDYQFQQRGAWSYNYNVHIGKRVSIGLSVLYENVVHRFEYQAWYDAKPQNRTVNAGYLSAVLNMGYKYYSYNLISLYSTASIGIGATTTGQYVFSTNPGLECGYMGIDFIAYQISPFGISYGKRFGTFAEVGFGYKGVASMGGFVKF